MDGTFDEFLVDEFLDFSNNGSAEDEEEEHPPGYNGKKPEKVEAENITNLSGKQEFSEHNFPVRTILRYGLFCEKKRFLLSTRINESCFYFSGK